MNEGLGKQTCCPLSKKTSLVIAAQPFGTAYPVKLESLAHKINLIAFFIIIFKNMAFMEIWFLSGILL